MAAKAEVCGEVTGSREDIHYAILPYPPTCSLVHQYMNIWTHEAQSNPTPGFQKLISNHT